MKFLTPLMIAAALFVGVAIGFIFNPGSETAPEAPKAPVTEKKIRNEGESAQVKALRAQIAALEKRLAERVEEQKTEPAPAENARTNTPPPWAGNFNPAEWRERMKREDPKRYAEITNHMARMRARNLERAQNKIDFFSSIDVSSMTPEARKTHTELQDLIAKREELDQRAHEAMENNENVSFEDGMTFFEQRHEMDRKINDLSRQERKNLFNETARNLGLEGEDAAAFTDTIQEIIRATDNGWGGRGGRGPGGRGPGGRGGRR